MSPLGWLMFALPILACGALAGVAMTKIREKHEQSAVFIAAGAGGYALFTLARHFLEGKVPADLFWLASPIVHVACVGAVIFGFMKFLDAMNPRRPQPLPPALASLAPHKPNMFVRGFFGFFGLMGILAGMRGGYDYGSAYILSAVAGAVALVAILAGSYFIDKQGAIHTWVLERAPEQIIWTYVHQLTVVNRRYGTRTVHWSAQLGLQSGAVIGVPALGETAAQGIAASVSMMRPGILIGYSADNLAKFKMMAKAAAPATQGPTSPGGPGSGIQSF